MQPKLPITLACGLLVAIFFIVIQSPSNQQTTAQDAKQSIGTLLDRLATNDTAMLELISQHGEELAAIEECHAEDSKDIKSKLVSLLSEVENKPAADQCDCDCGEKITDLERRVAELEARFPKTVTNYPAVSGTSGGGSTGTTVSGLGSAGSQVAMPVQQSYGSTGSAVVKASAPAVVRTPLRIAAAVVTSPIARVGHWTYPGEIGTHLAGDHGVATSGMSREQMLDLHDSLHEATAVQSNSPMQSPVRVQSNCPGGICPTSGPQYRTQSSGWFLGKNLGRR